MALQFPEQQKTVRLLTKHAVAPNESVWNLEKTKMTNVLAIMK